MQNWDDLRIFLAVARSRRIAPAARSLGVDATTVGRRLARLAARVERPLFESIGGERRLTEEGEALLAHAETVEAAVIAAIAPASDLAPAGHVRVSVAEGLATWVVAPAIAPFQASHPRIRLDLITASGFLNPSKREADIAIMLARPRSAQLRASEFARYRLRLYATSSYLDRHGRPRSNGDLGKHVLVGYVPEHIYAPELDYLSEIEPGLAPQVRSTSINVQHALVSAGAGIAVLPDFIARHNPRLEPVLEDAVAVHRTFWLVTHQDTHSASRIQAVCGWLESIGGGLG
ncbi:LysR family transcriptional regulator [Sphingomonas asaccharolytica]|uniref:LysR family transcriptional regulator n=1 Tax=Sphingomonas asaccharolytica TaxID=40681 RepID=UPI000836A1FB|nr:LysR family transcriptional regulator [Sphingomonas asaccharolytica]